MPLCAGFVPELRQTSLGLAELKIGATCETPPDAKPPAVSSLVKEWPRAAELDVTLGELVNGRPSASR